MKIRITKKIAEKVGYDAFKLWGYGRDSWGWKTKYIEIDLRGMEKHKLDQLAALFANTKDVYGAKVILKDIETWRDAGRHAGAQSKVPSVRMFESLLMLFMKDIAGHRVYNNVGNDRWFCFYLDDIEYKEKTVHGRGIDRWVDPEHVNFVVRWETYSGRHERKHRIDKDDCVGLTVAEVLAEYGYVAETEELRARYEKETARFKKVYSSIGKQYVLNGKATYTVTGKWRATEAAMAFVDARVVVDVINEAKANGNQHQHDDDDDDNEDGEEEADGFMQKAATSEFWKTNVINEETGEEESVGEPFEMPIHPYLKVFHLQKHMHYTVHVGDLQRYKYDTNLINKLVLDDKRKSLVKLLIEQRNSKYSDIISAKKGGAIVMLCGKPGTGKTLTAEVFAESEKRALYSVQCSQLGVTPEELEKELMTVLLRAQRWKAVLLLDEADVYVHKRGADINQNAIVGVFLRVLEYQNAIMFMTTNRAKDIDDAVASRCTAKLVYETPSRDEQRQIWRVLVDTAGAKMSDKEIAKTTEENPVLSGRDVKNLLKLAMLVTNDAITADTITFVKQFKPT